MCGLCNSKKVQIYLIPTASLRLHVTMITVNKEVVTINTVLNNTLELKL